MRNQELRLGHPVACSEGTGHNLAVLGKGMYALGTRKEKEKRQDWGGGSEGGKKYGFPFIAVLFFQHLKE